MVARMLGAAPVLADAVIEQLCLSSDAAADAHRPLGAQTEEQAEALSATVWHSIWPVERCNRIAAALNHQLSLEIRISWQEGSQFLLTSACCPQS